jgi:hypothetical protein
LIPGHLAIEVVWPEDRNEVDLVVVDPESGMLVRACFVASSSSDMFQVALAAGAPLGRAAWGGAHERLPTNLRVASAIATVVWIAAALVVLARAGFDASPIPASAAAWATWVLAGLLLVGAVMNLISRSRLERLIWGPVALVLAGLTAVVAIAE